MRDQILSSLLVCFCNKMEINLFPGLLIYYPHLNGICSNFFFFFNREEKAPSCFFFEQAETEGHLGVGLGLLRAPLFCSGRRVGFHFPGEGYCGTGLAGLATPVCRVLAQANQEASGSEELRPKPLLPEI